MLSPVLVRDMKRLVWEHGLTSLRDALELVERVALDADPSEWAPSAHVGRHRPKE